MSPPIIRNLEMITDSRVSTIESSYLLGPLTRDPSSPFTSGLAMKDRLKIAKERQQRSKAAHFIIEK